MAISITCSKCNAVFRVPDELAGKQFRCQQCAHLFKVNQPDGSSTHSSDGKSGKPTKVKPETAIAPVENKKPGKPKPDHDDDDNPDLPARRDKPAKSGMGLMVGVLLFLAFGLFGCLGCAGAVGWWVVDVAEKPHDPIVVIDDQPANRVIDLDKKADDAPKPDGIKDRDGPVKDKNVPPPDGAKDGIFKDGIGPVDGIKDPLPGRDGKVDPDKDRRIQLKQGTTLVTFPAQSAFIADANLGFGAPLNAARKLHDGYVARLEAGTDYEIELISTEFQSMLFLLDDGDRVLAQDDGGGKVDSRIKYRPERTGFYRIEAASQFKGQTGKYTLVIRRGEGATARTPPITTPFGDITLRIIPFRKTGKLAPDLVWSADAKSFYALTTDGLLQRVSVATGAVEQQQDFGRRCDSLAQSAAGLLMAVLDSQEVWLIDADKLDSVKAKFPVPMVTRVVSGAKSDFAVASSGSQPGNMGLIVLDLNKAAVGPIHRGFATYHLTASPDGKYVFANEGAQIKRYRLRDGMLTFEEESFGIGSNPSSICVSPDGHYVCMPSGGGNGNNHPNHPPAPPYSTYVYPAWDLKRPVFTIPSGAYPRVVGLDTTAGFAFAQNHDIPFIAFNFTGIKRGEVQTPPFSRGNDPLGIHVSPLGFQALLRSEKRVVHLQLQSKGEAFARLEAPPDPKFDPKIDPKVDPKKDPPGGEKVPPRMVQNIDEKNVTVKVITYPPQEAPLRYPTWAADGKSFFVLCQHGVLQRVNAETLMVEKTGHLKRRFDSDTALELSAAGLIIAAPADRQVLVVDPEDLETIKRKLNVPEMLRVAVGRDAKHGLAAVGGAKPGVRFLDFERGGVGPLFPLKRPGYSLRMSADGKYAFFSDVGKLFRYRIDQQGLIIEETSPAYAYAPATIQLSQDGQLISLAGAGAPPPADNPVRGLRVLHQSNFRKPVAVIAKVDHPRAVGIDARGGWIFVNEAKKPLAIHNLAGVKQCDITLPADAAAATSIETSPLGQAALIRTPTSILCIRINIDGATVNNPFEK